MCPSRVRRLGARVPLFQEAAPQYDETILESGTQAERYLLAQQESAHCCGEQSVADYFVNPSDGLSLLREPFPSWRTRVFFPRLYDHLKTAPSKGQKT
jgi:hypothetical protein